MIRELIKLAGYLDKSGKSIEADKIDRLIYKIAEVAPAGGVTRSATNTVSSSAGNKVLEFNKILADLVLSEYTGDTFSKETIDSAPTLKVETSWGKNTARAFKELCDGADVSEAGKNWSAWAKANGKDPGISGALQFLKETKGRINPDTGYEKLLARGDKNLKGWDWYKSIHTEDSDKIGFNMDKIWWKLHQHIDKGYKDDYDSFVSWYKSKGKKMGSMESANIMIEDALKNTTDPLISAIVNSNILENSNTNMKMVSEISEPKKWIVESLGISYDSLTPLDPTIQSRAIRGLNLIKAQLDEKKRVDDLNKLDFRDNL